jgi:SMODS and SLOG-associating 2TM effector domain family 4/Petal formation-expressed
MSDTAVDPVSPWSKAVVDRLRDWEQRAAAAAEVHFQMAESLSRWNIYLGVPVVALSAIVGTALFASLTHDVNVGIRIAAGTVSVIAAVLASIQTFLRFGARAEQHRVAAERWSAIRREIEKVRALPPELLGDPKQVLDDVNARMDEAADKALPMPDKRWKRALARQERATTRHRRPARST